ncbi:Tom22p [Sporobolomyces koalae]|uniref:Tom22p n=1 Tax=Sporobolomyces koalae TaxID=500713 RepID=UPI00316E87BA
MGEIRLPVWRSWEGFRSWVKVEEVHDDDAWSSASSDIDDAASDISDSELQLAPFDPDQETFAERFYALKDIVSPTTRAAVSDAADSTLAWTRWTANKVGNAAWIVTTSALLVGLPLLLSIEGEGALVQQEKEYLAQPGAAQAFGAPPAPGSVPAAAAVPQGF